MGHLLNKQDLVIDEVMICEYVKLTIFSPYPGKAIIGSCGEKCTFTLSNTRDRNIWIWIICSVYEVCGKEKEAQMQKLQAGLLQFISASPSTHIPVQWGDVFVTGYILPPLPNAVPQHQLSGSSYAALTQVPDPCGWVSRADGNNKTEMNPHSKSTGH